MTVLVKPTPRKNPLAPEEESKFYPYVDSNEEYDLNKLADLMSDGSTVRRNDIYAVLIGLVDITIKNLKENKKLRFGELGTFYLSVKGSPVDNVDDFSASQVKSVKICYRPGIGLKEELKSIHYSTRKTNK